jgi:hypothetical protein
MPTSWIRIVARGALFSSVCSCVGCGATGLDWVGEAHLESARLQHMNAGHVASSSGAMAGSIPATAEQNPNESRPRLNRTVSLGEIDVVAARADGGPAPVPAPSVNVYNYNQVHVVTPGYGYANYGYVRSPPGFLPGRVPAVPPPPSASGPLPGQNWPAALDHGPSFPYLASPAPPWTRTR